MIGFFVLVLRFLVGGPGIGQAVGCQPAVTEFFIKNSLQGSYSILFLIRSKGIECLVISLQFIQSKTVQVPCTKFFSPVARVQQYFGVLWIFYSRRGVFSQGRKRIEQAGACKCSHEKIKESVSLFHSVTGTANYLIGLG